VLNVALGGTLLQDIKTLVGSRVDHDPPIPRADFAHDVAVVRGTSLHQIMGGRDVVRVNSLHHQAVGDVGHGLVVSARSVGDDVVEGIESRDHRFVVGVQWHPESLWESDPGSCRLFEALVAACGVPCRA
jgi:putative glutamine amidotransferase